MHDWKAYGLIRYNLITDPIDQKTTKKYINLITVDARKNDQKIYKSAKK